MSGVLEKGSRSNRELVSYEKEDEEEGVRAFIICMICRGDDHY